MMINIAGTEYIQGIFLYETKHRFMCMVMIDEKEELCHVASSMKLEKVIALKGKRVLLTRNNQKDLRTQYTLLALIDKPWSLLNLSFANELVYKELLRTRKGLVQKEKYFKDYKTDIILDKKCIIEVKTVLSDVSKVIYPCTDTERGKKQLIAIKQLLNKGYTVELWIVYLNTRIKEVEVTDKGNYKMLLNDCITAGLRIIEKRVIVNDKCEFRLQRLNKSIIS